MKNILLDRIPDIETIEDYLDPLDYDYEEINEFLDDVDRNFGEGLTDSILDELIDNFDEAHGFIAKGDPFVEIQF